MEFIACLFYRLPPFPCSPRKTQKTLPSRAPAEHTRPKFHIRPDTPSSACFSNALVLIFFFHFHFFIYASTLPVSEVSCGCALVFTSPVFVSARALCVGGSQRQLHPFPLLLVLYFSRRRLIVLHWTEPGSVVSLLYINRPSSFFLFHSFKLFNTEFLLLFDIIYAFAASQVTWQQVWLGILMYGSRLFTPLISHPQLY